MVRELSIRRILKRLTLLSAPLPWAVACLAGDPISAVPSAQGPRIMLYFNQPIGPVGAARVVGLRIDQASTSPAPPVTAAVAPLGRRELVNLQIGAHANVRIDFARRLSWDFGRKQFNVPGDHQSDMALRFPTHVPASP